MAMTMPETIRSTATTGERLLFRTLKEYLPDDYIVYYEPEILGRRPDFVILGPDLGIIVLEVKDYTKNTLMQINQDTWMIRSTKGEQTTVKSPYKQAKDFMFHICDTLKKDKSLVQLEGKYQFKLKFPCGAGTVFTRMTQCDFIENDLYSVVEPNFCLTRDEIDPDYEGFSEENLFEKIINMFSMPFRLKESLTPEDINRIRYHLFPEVRISAEFKEPIPYQDQLLLSLHDIKTMDLHQEKLAKQIGDKNRLIRGVAGSGKTLVLAARAKLLAKQHPDWKILILCYNISLARAIEQMIFHMMHTPDSLFEFDFSNNTDGFKPQKHHIEVRNFHAFLKQDLKTEEGKIQLLLEKMEKGEVILPKYDAIMIDEGQDFESEWFKLVANLLNPDTMSLLLVEDRAQSIYKRTRSYIQDTGLSFQGRSKVLSINYRNTAQIVKFAWDFYQHFSVLKNKVVSKEINGEIIAPQSTRRKGDEPAIIRRNNFFEEARIVALQIQKLHIERKIPYHEILILYRVKKSKGQDYVAILQQQLSEIGIPYYWIAESAVSKRAFEREEESVKISTIDSSKGLDFQVVFMVNLDNTPWYLEEDVEQEVARLYIGMTRAKQYLCLSYSGDSVYTQYFDDIAMNRKKLKKSGSNSG
ncbi:3'-5' exonuclease [Lysinibacillus sp. NPDC097162]|uniref:3'-5' exonuclease n=1 Tax=Lysinibacillus sp. NPDC097162 TaxID=3364140 RepID=UPI0037F6B077